MNILHDITLKDVAVFFTSNCCNTQLAEVEAPPPCQTSAAITEPITSPIYHYFNDGRDLQAATITIGDPFLNTKDDLFKYRAIVKRINTLKTLNHDCNYYFTFEYSKSGMIHAHGIIDDLYLTKYIEAFAVLGLHNCKPASLTKINNFSQYWHYIHKDQHKRYFNQQKLKIKHNITKSKLKGPVTILDAKPTNLTCSGLALDGREKPPILSL